MPSSTPLCALARLLLSALVLTGALSAQRDKAPEFAVGDLADLEIRVVRKSSGPEASLLVVDVTNRGKLSAEPLTFEMEITGEPDPGGRFMRSRYHRAGSRTWGRAGRAIRPGKTERYWLPPLWGPNTPLERTSVKISRASFFKGKGIDKCPIELVKLEDVKEFDDFQKIEVKRTRATFRNPTPHPIHIHYLCYPRTGEGVWLCHSRVDPESDRVAGVDSPDPSDWDHLETTQRLFGRFERIEIVDWSVLVEPGHGSAREEFEAAWRSRFRWDFAMGSALEGRADWEWKDPNGGPARKGKAKFRFDGRDTTFETEPPLDLEANRRLLQAAADSLRVARSPSFEELVAACEIELVDRPAENSVVIELRPPARLQGPMDTVVLTITDGRIVAGATAGFTQRRTTHWTNVELPDGRYAPIGREVMFDNVPAWIRLELKDEVEWSENGGLRFPEVVRRHETDALSGRPNGDFVFRFSELAPSGTRDPGALRGDGVASLRAAWNKPWRHGARPRDLAGTLTIEAAASKDNWLGEAEVKGRLRVTGCTGRSESPHVTYEYRPSGKMSPEGRRSVGDLAAARSSIWTRGDFAGRASFEETFRGCALRLLPDDPDRVAVEGHREIASVKIEKGVPVEVVRKNGETLRYRFERKDGRLLPTATEWVFGDRVAVIATDFKKLASDFYYPSRVTMRDWFHAGWGPEVYTYRLKLE